MTADAEETDHPPVETFDGILEGLRRRYPTAKDSILFCIHKLQQNPDLGLRDFRDEAKLHGIALAGRSLHSARVLLGLERPTARATEPRRRATEARGGDGDDGSIESKVIHAVRQIQNAALGRSDRLRRAIEQAISVLQAALDGVD